MFYSKPALRGKVGQPKCIHYSVGGVHDWKSDLEHMLIAFGPDRVIAMVHEKNAELIAREKHFPKENAKIANKGRRIRRAFKMRGAA